MTENSKSTDSGELPNKWLKIEDPENQGAFIEDAITTGDAEESVQIADEYFPEGYGKEA